MQTLTERLSDYCEKNNKATPYGKHRDIISFAIIEELKAMGAYDKVKKKNESWLVNNYPNELLPVVDRVIEKYFTDRASLIKIAERKVKYFNYDVEEYKAPAFEAALLKCGFEVIQNFNQKGTAQYKIPLTNPVYLIKLGKAFQKERWIQRSNQRTAKPNNQ